jgi:Ca-activated chloride channel family protein
MADDRRIDDALRNVPLPPGLADRVVPETLFDDAALDRLLGRVTLPAGLSDRVRAAVFTPAAGRGVDLERAAGSLRPAGKPTAPRQRGRLGRWSLAVAQSAASVAVLLAALGGLVLTGFEFARWVEPTAPQPAVVLAPQPPSPGVLPLELAVGMAAQESSPSLEPNDPLAVVPTPVLADDDAIAVTEPDPFTAAPPMVRGAAVGSAAGALSDAAAMKIVPLPRAEPRRSVPRVAGYDMAFEMTHGESPFIDPRTAAALQVDRPPLSIRTDAFEALVDRAGRKPRPGFAASMRTEEILAALPAPPSRSAATEPQVMIHAVRSLRGRPESRLVEVCVTAPPLARDSTPAVDAMLALDRHTGSEPLLWAHICRAVAAVADQMRDGDRMTVVVGGREPRLAGTRLDAAGLRRLATALEIEPGDDATEFDATMQFAAQEVERGPARPLIVVANSESVDRARGAGRAAVSAWREALAADGPEAGRRAAVRFVLIDPTEPTVREPLEPGFGRTPADAVAIRRAVLEQVFATPTITARQCRLQVAFDPQAVAAYRLVGHRQSAMESLAGGDPPASDLHAGEVTRVVYEMVPLAMKDAAVKATLACRPVNVAGERTFTAVLSLRAVTPGLPPARDCELLLAVAVGELATASPHAGPRGTAAHAAAALAAAWWARGDVTPFGTALLEAADRIGLLKTSNPAPKPRR